MEKAVLKKLQPSEIGSVTALSDRYGSEELKNLLSKPFVKVHTLWWGEKIVGYAVVWIVGEEAQLHWFEIFRPFRGKGWANTFMGELLKRLQKEGVKRVTLEVSEKNTPALKVYLKWNFQRVGTRKGYYPDGSDALLMERNL